MLFGPLVLDSSTENQLWGVALLVLCLAAFVPPSSARGSGH